MQTKQDSGEVPAPGPHGVNLDLVARKRTPYYNKSLPSMLSWSQKAGCTTVLRWFLYQVGLLDDALAFVSTMVGLNIYSYENQVLQADPDYRTGVVSNLKAGGLVINFIRCPYERAFSGYILLYKPRETSHWVGWSNSAFKLLRWNFLHSLAYFLPLHSGTYHPASEAV